MEEYEKLSDAEYQELSQEEKNYHHKELMAQYLYEKRFKNNEE